MNVKRPLPALGGLAVLVAALGALVVTWLDLWPWPSLRVGSPAPDLAGCEWLQGEPVDPGHPGGKVIVVECWATWCGPCIGAMPHLDILQHRYADAVRVVGVAMWDEREAVARFVARRGSSIGYALAFDADDQARKHWMRAARQSGIPCSFVVDRDGRIAWIGHPFGLDGVLAELVAGTFDRELWRELDGRDELWEAFSANDRAELERIGAELTRRAPSCATGWSALVAAAADAESRGTRIDAALAALAGNRVQLAWFAEGLVRREQLGDRTDAVLAALELVIGQSRDLALHLARVRTLLAAGRPEAAVAAARESTVTFLEQPFELVALVEGLLRVLPGNAAAGGPPSEEETAGDGIVLAAQAAIERAAATIATPHVTELRFDVLRRAGVDAEAVREAGRAVIRAHGADARALNSFSWQLLDEAGGDATLAQVALEAATAMTACDGWENANTLDTLALAKFENGMVDEAIALQERAIAANGQAQQFRERLERYRAARGVERGPQRAAR